MDSRLPILSYNLFLGPFGGVNVIISMMNVLQKDLNTSLEMVTLSITMAMFPFAIMQFFTGALADSWDPKKTIISGMSIYLAAAVICALSPDIWVFLVGRFIQGVGLAFVNPVALALVGEIVPPQRRGYVMGWMGTINTFGIAMGPLAGGLAAGVNWRYVYYVIIAMSAVAILLFQFGFGRIERKPKGPSNIAANLVRVGSMRSMQLVSFAGFAAFFGYGTALTFVGDYMEGGALAMSPPVVGMAISLGSMAGIITSPIAGWSSDRLGRTTVSIFGFSLAALTYFLFTFVNGFNTALMLFAMLGVAQGFVWAGIMTLSVELVPDARSTASTLFNGTRFTGYSIAPVILVYMYTSMGLTAVLLVAMGMALFGLVLTVALRSIVPTLPKIERPPK